MVTSEIEIFKIGETYIKFDFEYSESNKSIISEALLNQINFKSIGHFKSDELFKMSIEYEKGSLKTRIIIWGTALYMGIANYGSFRAGIREIVNDSKRFSEFVIERIDNDPNINSNHIIRVERRTGLPGRMQELYSRIDHYERNIDNMSIEEIHEGLNNIKQEIANLIVLLPAESRQCFLIELDNKFTQELPSPNEKRTSFLINRYGLKPEDEIEFIQQ